MALTTVRVLAVDPATGLSGWAILDVTYDPQTLSLDTLNIKIVKTGLENGEKLKKTKKELLKNFSRAFCIVDALEELYIKLMVEYGVDEVASEGAYGYVHLSALISLTLAINGLRRASRIVRGRDIHVIPPTITKNAFTGSGGASKEDMRKAFFDRPYLDRSNVEESISEHEIDAVGHGVGYVMRDILKLVIQKSNKEKKKKKRRK